MSNVRLELQTINLCFRSLRFNPEQSEGEWREEGDEAKSIKNRLGFGD